MVWELPTKLDVGGTPYAIRSDFRDVLRVLSAFEDVDLTQAEKQYICLYIIYEDYDSIPEELYPDAMKAAMAFIDAGASDSKKGPTPRTIDWEQDARLLFPAINKVAGYETRSVPYLHWWTFVGFFMEIHDSAFATVLSIRAKRAKGKSLDPAEKEFFNANKSICVIQPRLTEEEKAEKERLNRLLK